MGTDTWTYRKTTLNNFFKQLSRLSRHPCKVSVYESNASGYKETTCPLLSTSSSSMRKATTSVLVPKVYSCYWSCSSIQIYYVFNNAIDHFDSTSLYCFSNVCDNSGRNGRFHTLFKSMVPSFSLQLIRVGEVSVICLSPWHDNPSDSVRFHRTLCMGYLIFALNSLLHVLLKILLMVKG